jgi:hypothetical protein
MTRNNVLGLAARIAKLRAMSAREVVDRLRYRLFVDAERRRHRANRLAPPDRLERALTPDLQGPDWQQRLLAARRASAGRFLPSVSERARVRQLFETTFHRELQDTMHHAARARDGRFEFFGGAFEYAGDIDWHADPVSGRRWPVCYHADVPVHGGDAGYGDVKHVWELSRQQYVMDLAKSYFLTSSAPDLDAMRRLVRSWIAGNPYATGVNWSCALEPAFRAWSWLWAYHLTADALDDEFHVEWLRGFYDHGRFLAAHLEHYSSPYNHLIGEAATLFALGLCFPEFRDAAQWRRRGRRVLDERLDQQFYRDGGSVEQSTFYHHATTGFYLLAALVGRANGEDLSPRIWSAIERALDFSRHLMQPDGRMPEIGGADDGKPIRMEHLPFWDFRPYQAIGAVVFGRPDLKAAAGRFFEDALWLLGPAGLDTFAALESPPVPDVAVALEPSGYFVARHGPIGRADYLCFDVGEQAAGMRQDAVANSMHGHADCLSVIAWLGGSRLLVDSGLYAYNCGGAWEAHFRETAAHNTARVDGRDQARHLGKMAWSHSYRAVAEQWQADPRDAWIIGSHDGFARGPNGVLHRRAVWLRAASLVVYDEFVGEGPHDFEVNFQFAPGQLSPLGGNRVRFDDVAEIAWTGTEAWNGDISCGGDEPSAGWICSSLGVRQPAPRLTLRSRSAAPRTALVTVLAVGHRVSVVRTTGAEAGHLVAVTGGDVTEWIGAGAVSGSTPFETDALIARCTVTRDGAIERAQVGGTYLNVDVDAVARLEASLSTPTGP